MALHPGARFGSYEIAALLGAGGMGEVYRAADTRLKRQVAIKILPAPFAADTDRRARFQREAETLASLDHPNIARVHGLEDSDGETGLVMELIEGTDLSARIARGPVPLQESLTLATQIAAALETAHEAGIMHRDLKPANIRIRSDGTVKILDFGLAKALDSASAQTETRAEALTAAVITAPSMLLGTTAYMSPEQLRAGRIDRRSDIWAFGCVLYEMLTGRPAFAGKDTAAIIAAVLTSEPDWARLPPGMPSLLDSFLRRCLNKDPRQRIADMQDMRLALQGAFASTGASGLARTDPKRGPAAWFSVGAAVATAVSFVPWAILQVRNAPIPSAPELRTDIVTPDTPDPKSFALSPDGRSIVFVASADGGVRLWLRSLDSTTAQPVAGTDGATFPFWSPDNHSVAFFADGSLKRVDLPAGRPQIITPATGPRGGTWSASGVILFALSSGSLLRVPAGGGEAVPATQLDRQSSHRYPFFLPDGRRFVFLAQGPDAAASGLYLGSLESTEIRRLAAATASAVYAPPGWLFWPRADTLVAQRLDLSNNTLVGDPITIASPVIPNEGDVGVSVSQTGMVAYRSGSSERRQLVWFDRSGTKLGTVGEVDGNNLSTPRLSPNGHSVVVARTVQGNTDIWLIDGGRTSRITFEAALDQFPMWSAGGSKVVFQSDRKGHRDIYQKIPTADAPDTSIIESDEAKIPTDWSADGQFLLYYSLNSQTARDLWIMPAARDRGPSTWLKTPFDERWAQFSPDRRWIAYVSNESGRNEIYLRRFSQPSGSVDSETARARLPASTAGGLFPLWRHDGRELYYIDPAGRLMAAPITESAEHLAVGTPVALFPTRIFGAGQDNTQGRQYDVAADGRFLINVVLDDPSGPITLLQNWQRDVR